MQTPSERVQTKKPKEVQAEHVSSLVKPYKPPVPYPQRLLKAREEHKYGKFLEMLKISTSTFPFLRPSLTCLLMPNSRRIRSPTKGSCLRMLRCLSLRSAVLLFRTSFLISFLIQEVSLSLVQLGMLL